MLRPFNTSDAKRVQLLAGHLKVAATPASIPYPYIDDAAEEWIGMQAEWFQKGLGVQFAIVIRQIDENIMKKIKYGKIELPDESFDDANALIRL